MKISEVELGNKDRQTYFSLPRSRLPHHLSLPGGPVGVSRRLFLKYCIGSAAALGLDFSILGTLEKAVASGGPLKLKAAAVNVPTYPITPEVFTTSTTLSGNSSTKREGRQMIGWPP